MLAIPPTLFAGALLRTYRPGYVFFMADSRYTMGVSKAKHHQRFREHEELSRPANAISAPLWRRARTEESRLGDSIQRFGRQSSRSHEPAVECFDGVAPNRPDKDKWTSYQPQRPIHRQASQQLKGCLE